MNTIRKEFYDEDVLKRMVTEGNSIPKIKSYLDAEVNGLKKYIPSGATVIDFGCGDGRHLRSIEEQINFGLGIDIVKEHIAQANSLNVSKKLKFEVNDATTFYTNDKFSVAISMYYV